MTAEGRNLEGYADALAEELMTEMADTFFGGRRRLEQDMEAFRDRVSRLRDKGRKARGLLGAVHALLLDEAGVRELYQTLGADRSVAPGEGARVDASAVPARAWALLPSSRYARRGLAAYRAAADACADYMHGSHVTDEDGKKRLTVNYTSILQAFERLRGRVRAANEDTQASDVLRYAKSLDPKRMEQEKVTGATLEDYAGSVDKSYAVQEPEFTDLGIVPLPELPPAKEVRGEVLRLFRAAWSRRPGDARAVQQRLLASKEEE